MVQPLAEVSSVASLAARDHSSVVDVDPATTQYVVEGSSRTGVWKVYVRTPEGALYWKRAGVSTNVPIAEPLCRVRNGRTLLLCPKVLTWMFVTV